MRTCHHCFVHCFGGLLGPHFNTLDLFASVSIHLAGFLHVVLIYFFFFSCFFRRYLRVSAPHGWPRPAQGTDLAVRAGSAGGWAGYLWLRFLSVKPRAGEQMRLRWQRCRPPRAAIVQPTVCSAACSARLAPCVPPSPFFRHLRVKVRVYLARQKAGLELLKYEMQESNHGSYPNAARAEVRCFVFHSYQCGSL